MKLLPWIVLAGMLAGCVHQPPSSGLKHQPACCCECDTFTVVHRDDSAGGAGWSDAARGASLRDGKVFHGPFEARPVVFSQSSLPAHGWVRVKFDLLLLGKWDGSSRVWGPDLFSLSVRGGPRLLWASFGNCGFWVNNNEQSYPDEYPWAVHPGWTGAVEKQADGLRPSGYKLGPAPGKTDSVYTMEMVFPHTESSLILDFAGIYDDAAGDQSWGVRNLEIAVSAEAPTPAEELPALWRDLASPDPVRADHALWRMVGAGDAAKAFIAARVEELDRNRGQEAGVPENGLRLHRAHRIVRIIGGPGSGGTCFALDHLFPEY